jgi:hypothetical protein
MTKKELLKELQTNKITLFADGRVYIKGNYEFSITERMLTLIKPDLIRHREVLYHPKMYDRIERREKASQAIDKFLSKHPMSETRHTILVALDIAGLLR